MAFTRWAGCALSIAVLAFGGCADGEGANDQGALSATAQPDSVVIGLPPMEIGEVGLVSGPNLLNDSDGAAVVEDVQLLGLPAAVAVEGWVLMDNDDSGGVGAVLGDFPPAGARAPDDRTVEPTQTRNDLGELVSDVQVVIGLRLLEAGVHESSTVRVTYTDERGRHTVDVRFSFVVCGPPVEFPSSCRS